MNNESDTKAPEESPAEASTEPSAEAANAGPQFNWEYREEFRINRQMREIVTLAKVVTEAEIDRLRRKLEKLTYGS